LFALLGRAVAIVSILTIKGTTRDHVHTKGKRMAAGLLHARKWSLYLQRVPALAFLLIPIVLFLSVHLALRLFGSPGLHEDDADILFFNQSLAWGYSEQPPLYSWIYYFLSLIVGESLFSLTLQRILLIAVTACFVYAAARELFEDRSRALLSGVAIFAVPVLAWHSLTYLTHSLLLCCLCAATLWAGARVGRSTAWRDYLTLGICAGLGLLSKYNYVFFLAGLIIAASTMSALRRQFLSPRMLAAAGLAGVIVLPHALWAWQYRQLFSLLYLHKTGVAELAPIQALLPAGVVELFKNVVLLTAPTVALFALTFPDALRVLKRKGELRGVGQRVMQRLTTLGSPSFLNGRRSQPQPTQHALIARTWLGRFFIVLILLHLAYAFAVQARCLHERWLEPFTLFLPMYFLSGVGCGSRYPVCQKRYICVLLIAAICLTVGHGAQIWLGGSQRGYNTMDSDFRLLTRQLQWEINPGSPIIAENPALAGNLRLCLPASPCLSAQEPLCRQPTPVIAQPCVLLWDSETSEDIPPRLRACVRRAMHREPNHDAAVRQVELPPAAVGRQRKTIRYVVLE
jgi:4-amino-4-deoxy-L-arabinose transferase-like glycosyltransferase